MQQMDTTSTRRESVSPDSRSTTVHVVHPYTLRAWHKGISLHFRELATTPQLERQPHWPGKLGSSSHFCCLEPGDDPTVSASRIPGGWDHGARTDMPFEEMLWARQLVEHNFPSRAMLRLRPSALFSCSLSGTAVVSTLLWLRGIYKLHTSWLLRPSLADLT